MFAHATLHSQLGPDGRHSISPLAGRWVCPMHPDINAGEPGTCSVCGMDLALVQGESGADAEVAAALLAVPVSAVLDTGARRLVYVEEQPGRFAAREVALGPRAGVVYPVLSGLAEGERVVVHGAFLLDSQAQIEGKPSLLFPKGLLGGAAAAGAHAGHGGGR
jgi:Cu(I)/Ag(I) efflux system membrane fusion protein